MRILKKLFVAYKNSAIGSLQLLYTIFYAVNLFLYPFTPTIVLNVITWHNLIGFRVQCEILCHKNEYLNTM